LPGDGNTGAGLTGDIRYCINQANLANDNSTITFDTEPWSTTPAAINLHAPLSILASMTIQGPDRNDLIISGWHWTEVFNIGNVTSQPTVTISGLTISDGYASSGGAISSVGSLTVTGCTFRGNFAEGDGGAIDLPRLGGLTPKLTVSNCTFSSNRANRYGHG